MTSRRSTIVIAGLLMLGGGHAQGQTWLETELRIEELAEAGEYPAVVELEEEYLTLVAETFGESSFELADAHLLMASIHSTNADHLVAQASILAAVEIIEGAEGPLSTRLIAPYLALGRDYHRAEDYDLAIRAFDEARALSRRAHGLFNPGQIPMLRLKSDSMLALDEYVEARELRGEALELLIRENGPGSIESFEASYAFAAWLSEHRDFRAADRMYGAIAGMIENEFGNDPRLMLNLLRIDAANRRRGRMTGGLVLPGQPQRPGQARELTRALELLDQLESPNPRLRAEILLERADTTTAFEITWEIEDDYRDAWNALQHVDDGERLREEWFSEATAVYVPLLESRHLSEAADGPWGYVVASFTIETDGRPDDVEFLESQPAGLLDTAVRRQILNSRYRPRMVDGELVESTVSARWDFQYETD